MSETRTRFRAALQRELADAGRIDWQLWRIDGSHVRAHRHAAGAEGNRPPGEPADHVLGRSRGGFTTKLHLVTDGAGLPLAIALSAGQAHESLHATRGACTGRAARHSSTARRTADAAPSSARSAR